MRVHLFILLIAVCHSVYAQDCNVKAKSVVFEEYTVGSLSPVYCEFSADEKTLYYLQQQNGGFMLYALDVAARKTIFVRSIQYSKWIREFSVSPNGKDLLVKNIEGDIYYIPDFRATSKLYPMEHQFYSYSFCWIDHNLVKINLGREESQTVVFDIDKWSWKLLSNWEKENGSWTAKYQSIGRIKQSVACPYTFSFSGGTILPKGAYGVQLNLVNTTDNTSSFLRRVDAAGQAISSASNQIAFVQNGALKLLSVSINQNNAEPDDNEILYCFDINDFETIPQTEIEKLKNLLAKQETVEAEICFPRLHPVTGNPVGPGRGKASLKVINLEGKTLFARLISKYDFNTQINEGDYVAALKSRAKSAGDDLGSSWPLEIYKWNLNTKLKKNCHQMATSSVKPASKQNSPTYTNEVNNNVGSPSKETYSLDNLAMVKDSDSLLCSKITLEIYDELGRNAGIKDAVMQLFSKYGGFAQIKSENINPAHKKINLIVSMRITYFLSTAKNVQEYFADCNYSLTATDSTNRVIFNQKKKLSTFDLLTALTNGASNKQDALQYLITGKINKEVKKACDALFKK